MQVLRQVTGRLTSWWNGPPTRKAYHPEGKFDKHSIISAIDNIERLSFKAEAVVMTRAQYDELVRQERYFTWRVGVIGYDPSQKFMGCKIEIDDVPKWCVGVEDEW